MDLYFLLHVFHVKVKKKKKQNQQTNAKVTPNKNSICLHNMKSKCSFLIKGQKKF